jgi:two-component system sensor histidine kinase BaeS
VSATGWAGPVTADRRTPSGPLALRLFAAFVVVALSAVAVLSGAALVGTRQGLASVQREERQQASVRVAAAAADAYETAGGWVGADLAYAASLADGLGAGLAVRDRSGAIVRPGHGRGPGAMGHTTGASGADLVTGPVVVSGEQVGSVRLTFPAGSDGRAIAWSWVLGAALVALLSALVVSAFVAGRLGRPLTELASAARRFAAGDRTARAGADGPGEIGELARAFDEMAEEVTRTERGRRRLAADVAHELRTPLAALQAGLEELRDGLRAPDTERLAALHDQALRLGRVVDDLSDLSAAEAAALSLRVVDADLAGIARRALAGQRPLLEAAGLTLEAELTHPDVPVPVRVDPDRLHQAVTNVLANAARYCRPGDRVRVRVAARGDSAVLVVADTGPGIEPGDLPHVFERLWRGPGTAGVAGSGIGLAVVREIVSAHGGTVSAESPPGAGTTVTLRLPLAPAAAFVARRPPRRRAPPGA